MSLGLIILFYCGRIKLLNDLPPFASTAIPCPSLLNVLVMPAIAERYDIMINTLYHNVACYSVFFYNINTYSLIVGSLQ